MLTFEDPEFDSEEESLLPDDEEIESTDLGCQCAFCGAVDLMDLEEDVEFVDEDDDWRDGIAAD